MRAHFLSKEVRGQPVILVFSKNTFWPYTELVPLILWARLETVVTVYIFCAAGLKMFLFLLKRVKKMIQDGSDLIPRPSLHHCLHNVQFQLSWPFFKGTYRTSDPNAGPHRRYIPQQTTEHWLRQNYRTLKGSVSSDL